MTDNDFRLEDEHNHPHKTSYKHRRLKALLAYSFMLITGTMLCTWNTPSQTLTITISIIYICATMWVALHLLPKDES